MDREKAKKDAAALRYRLGVRLGLVAQQARREDQPELLDRAKALRAEVDAVEIADDEASTRAAEKALLTLKPRVLDLQQAAGIPEYGLPIFPRWLEITLITAPVLLVLAVVGFVFNRRRKKKEVDEATLRKLEEAAE